MASLSLQQTPHFQGGVLAPNGKIYLIPSFSTVLYLIDPSNNTVTAYQTIVSTGSQQHTNGVLGPNGKIYCNPNGTSLLSIIDPDTNTYSKIVNTALVGLGVAGANVAPNGKIYFTPTNSIGFFLDPFNNNTIGTYSCAPVITGPINSFGGKLAPNGKIYFSSWTGTFFGVLDPETNTVTRLGTVTNGAYLDLVVTQNGKLVLIPTQATSVTAYNLLLNNNWNINLCTSPLFNRN